jgi:hypothetical protein
MGLQKLEELEVKFGSNISPVSSLVIDLDEKIRTISCFPQDNMSIGDWKSKGGLIHSYFFF